MTNLTSAPILVAFTATLFSLATPSLAAENSFLGKPRTELERALKGWTINGDPLSKTGSAYYTRDGIEVDARFEDGKVVAIMIRPENGAPKNPKVDQRLRDTHKLLGLSDRKPTAKPN